MKLNRNFWFVVCIALFAGFAFSSVAISQSNPTDNIGIEAISKIEVKDNILEVTVQINNSNAQVVKIRKGKDEEKSIFKFKFGAIQKDASEVNSTTITVQAEEIGKDSNFNSTDMDVNSTQGQVFKLDMGGDSCKILGHIMNCIGNPGLQKPYIEVNGIFELGVKSSKGWTYARDLEIDWLFIPKTPSSVNLYTAK